MRDYAWFILFLMIPCLGCGSSPIVVDKYLNWGKGVHNPDYTREKAIALLSDESNDERFSVALGMLLSMNWQQACYVYRTSPAASEIKALMCVQLLQHRNQMFRGMNQKDVIKLIGQPDDICEDNRCWVYTGTGAVSDDTPACTINFDEAGMFTHVGHPS